jgi:iron complex outermembrane receptor protein
MKTTKPLLLCICFAFPIVTLLAQTAPAPTVSSTESAVVLNPFVVSTSTETGYAATNTLDGSRLNTALRDTPAAISVFTRDFLNDISATDVTTLLRYDLSTEFDFNDGNSEGNGLQTGAMDTGAAWRTRGLTGSASSNGFRDAGGADDLYNVESAGSTRGPNAILFGTGAAGGVLNLRTKTANPMRNSASIELKAGSFDLRRGTFDFNRTLRPKKAALRVMGVYDHKGHHMPHKYTEKIGATLAGQYRFTETTTLSLSYERNRTEGVGGRTWGALDSITAFRNALRSGQVVFDRVDERYETLNGAIVGASSGVGNLANRTVLVYGPDLGTPTLWEGATTAANRTTLSSTASQFTGAKPIVDESIAPFNAVTFTGASEYGEIEYQNFNATVNHRWFKNFYMELAYNLARRSTDSMISQNPELRADLNYRLPGGALNPYFFGNGYYFGQQNYIRLAREFRDETLRASFSYELDLKRFGHHRFAALAERHTNNNKRLRTVEVWAGAPYGGTPEATNNRIFRRRYFQIDGPYENYTTGYNSNPLAADSYASAFPALGTLTSTWVAANDVDFDDKITTDSQLFVMQNYLFNRRLVTTVGLRRDAIETFGPRTLRDAQTQAWRFATAADQPSFDASGRTWFEATDEGGDRRSLGAVLHLTKNFSLTANASDGIELPSRNRTVLPFERVPDPYKGEGRDYGLNFSFFDNRLAGSFKYYKSSSLRENTNEVVQTVFGNPNNDVMASFEYYFRQANLTTFGGSDPIKSVDELRSIYFSDADSYLSDRISKGYEFETIANPTRAWTIRAGYAYTDRTRTNVLSEGEPWWEERNALWKSLDSLYMTRTGRPSVFNQLLVDQAGAVTNRTVAARIADSATELTNVRLEEEQGYGNRKHKANLWTRYSFLSGALRGVAVGGGYRYQSRNIAGFDVDAKRTLYGNPRSLFDLLVQYRTKGLLGRWRDRTTVTYQVNMFNVLDDQTIYISKRLVDTATGGTYNRRAWREDPRSTTFTVRMDF